MNVELNAELTKVVFLKFSQLIENEVGIHLSEAKMPLLTARLAKRLRRLELPTFRAYFERVLVDADERVAMFDAISTNETRFFREPKHFEFLDQHLLPAIKAQALRGERPKTLHVWSAGCSTGEEPYSLAMTLLTHFDPMEWDLRIHATDLSTRVLDFARAGVWPMSRVAEIPKTLLRRFFLHGTGTNRNTCKAGDDLRSIIRFGRLNLTDPQLAMPEGYDLVFCRNVLIYFRNAMRSQVVGNLLHHLQEGGHLFLGHAETLAGIAAGPRTVIPTVYVK